ncbi:MAG: hypothetical protein ACI93R_003095 [Flavobacteriales bacterium]|jgi:hypothetical protein
MLVTIIGFQRGDWSYQCALVVMALVTLLSIENVLADPPKQVFCKHLSTLVSCDKTGFSPYIGPYLTLIKPNSSSLRGTSHVLNPATSMVINYEVTANVFFEALVFYREATEQEWILQKEDDYSSNLDMEWGRVRHISLEGLTPDTLYHYRVLAPNGVVTREYSFRTASSEADYSRFLVIGDMQDELQSQRWQDVADTITQDHMDDFDFILTVGDMVKDDISHQGDRFYWWRVFFDKGENLFAHKPMFPAMGNHDTPANPTIIESKPHQSNPEDARAFRKYFYMNTDMSYPDYYAFSYGNACFISVNSEIPVFSGVHPERKHAQDADAKQKRWLDSEVKKAGSCQWSFAYWHVPPINPAGGKDEVRFLRPYAESFSQNIDWSITGHVHEYQRLNPVQIKPKALDFMPRYGRDKSAGVGHMIAPPAGQWPRGNSSDDMSQLAYYPHNKNGVAFEVGFSIINVSQQKFSLNTYGLGGVGTLVQPKGYRENDDRSKHLIDTLIYEKPGP